MKLDSVYAYWPLCSTNFPRSIECHFRGVRTIIEWVSAEWTSALVAARKPLEEAARVEQILAGLAALIRHLLIRRYDGVTNRALGLSLESADDVFAEYA